MKHLFVPYELALLAKEKGFEDECFGFYNVNNKLIIVGPINLIQINTKAPLYQQLMDWFIEKHRITILVFDVDSVEHGIEWCWSVTKQKVQGEQCGFCLTYNEALNRALDEAFKLI